jgi:hypothetical protein
VPVSAAPTPLLVLLLVLHRSRLLVLLLVLHRSRLLVLLLVLHRYRLLVPAIKYLHTPTLCATDRPTRCQQWQQPVFYIT